MAGSIDIYNNRRTYHDKCYFWKRDEDKPLEEYREDKKSATLFYSKEVSSILQDKNTVNGMFMFDSDTLTIATPDFIDIKAGDVVLFDEEMWRVRNVQIAKKHCQQAFGRKVSRITYIQLKK